MIRYEKVISKLYNTELVKDWFIKMSYWTQCLVHFFMNQFLTEKSYLTKHCLTIRDSVVTKTAHPGLILMSESSNIIETMPAWIALWILNIWWAITDNTYMRSNNKIRFFFQIFWFTNIHNWQHYFITCVSILWNSSKHDQAPQDAKPLRNLAKAL